MKAMFVARASHNMAGGVERMITTVMKVLMKRGHSIDLFTWDQVGATVFNPMTSKVTVLHQGFNLIVRVESS